MLTWKKNTNKYANGILGYLGKWNICSIFWSIHGSEKNPYELQCRLPGIKEDLGFFKNIEAGKVKAEEITKFWLKGANVNHGL